jgi:hypothetical protein
MRLFLTKGHEIRATSGLTVDHETAMCDYVAGECRAMRAREPKVTRFLMA